MIPETCKSVLLFRCKWRKVTDNKLMSNTHTTTKQNAVRALALSLLVLVAGCFASHADMVPGGYREAQALISRRA